jgi:predicted NBD/HSP70 family sugar kinase
MTDCVAALDIGGTTIKGAVVDCNGTVRESSMLWATKP